MKRRAVLLAIISAAALVSVAFSGANGGAPSLFPVTVTINGIPGNGLTPFGPLTLTTAQLAALPQQTENVLMNGVLTTEKGPLLSAVITDAGLTFLASSACKNDELRFFAQATSASGAAAEITLGELDPFFGNNQAILSINEARTALVAPRLVVPGDKTDARDISDVITVIVGRAAPQLADTATPGCTTGFGTPPVAAPAPGSVTIDGAVAATTTLTWAQLQALPQVTQTVSAAGLGTNVTEVGPTLLSALDLAGLGFDPSSPSALRYYVEVTSSEDGYAANVSWAEIAPAFNGNEILLSLSQSGVSQQSFGPKLTVPGDTHAGRFVSGTALITVFAAPVETPVAGSGPSLQGANLRAANLTDDFLVGASLQNANLNGTDLEAAFLNAANLSGANLNKADLAGTFLTGADLTGANLHGANLTGAIWSNTTCPDGSNSDTDGGTCAINE